MTLGVNVPPLYLADVDAVGNLPEGLGMLKGQALVVEGFDRPQQLPFPS